MARIVRALAASGFLLGCGFGAPGASAKSRPIGNVALCTAAGDQTEPRIVADGAGGAFVAWQDRRSGEWDVYVHHLVATMLADPTWPKDGLALSTAAHDQHDPRIVADGQGGAIVVWLDTRNAGAQKTAGLYAQHVLASGVDTAWAREGVPLCATAVDQNVPAVVADRRGGVIVAWLDSKTGSDYYAMSAHHVLPDGSTDPAWPADGRVLCAVVALKSVETWQHSLDPVASIDGAGGAFVAWSDRRRATHVVHAQHVLESGALAERWPADGLAISATAGNQDKPAIVSDGGGGVIVGWEQDHQHDWDIYAQHILSSATLDPAWPAAGRAVCAREENQLDPDLAPDGTGGAIVTWIGGAHAQHVLAGGELDPAWPAEGRQLCERNSYAYERRIVADGSGGAFVAWSRVVSSLSVGQGGLVLHPSADIFAQHVMGSGRLDPNWPADGMDVCSAGGSQFSPQLVSDGAHGAIVSWCDARSKKTGKDIYAQFIRVRGAAEK